LHLSKLINAHSRRGVIAATTASSPSHLFNDRISCSSSPPT
jgi:hypothetical protein